MEFVKSIALLDSANATTELLRIDVADLDGNGVVEIIPQFEFYFDGANIVRYYSIFYKRDIITSIDVEEDFNPNNFALYQNYPNPFNPETKIKYSLPSVSLINIKIYNSLGKEIKQLLNETRNSGEYETSWDGTDNNGNKVSSGVYFITMEANPSFGWAGGFRKTIKAVLLK